MFTSLRACRNNEVYVMVMMVLCVVQLSYQEKDIECADKKYKSFKNCIKNPLQFTCAKQILVEYPHCFFKEITVSNKHESKHCMDKCDLQYKRCIAAARKHHGKVLIFPCKVGGDVCINNCHVKKLNPTSIKKAEKKTCRKQCTSDFLECFVDIRGLQFSKICTETKKHCDINKTCYRLITDNDDAIRISSTLKRFLKKLYS